MPNTNALRIEDLHLSYKDLIGERFSKPKTLSFFEKQMLTPEKELLSDARWQESFITSENTFPPKGIPLWKSPAAKSGLCSRTVH